MLPTISGYTLIERAGSGGQAEVFRARQARLNRQVAIKIIKPDQDTTAQQRFLNEAKMLSNLHHPHIVTVYDIGDYEGRTFMVMEWLGAESLPDQIGNRRLTETDVARIIRQIAAALSAIHHHNIVHRDIKPSNILLRENGDAVLGDFGIAKELDEGTRLTEIGKVVGSDSYMSPEQRCGERLDSRSDIYSLGVVLFKMLVACLPTEMAQVSNGSRQSANPFARQLPAALAQYQPIIDRMVTLDPNDRFPTVTAFLHAFNRVAPQEDTLSVAAQPTLTNFGRRWSFLWVGLTLVLALGTVSSAYWYYQYWYYQYSATKDQRKAAPLAVPAPTSPPVAAVATPTNTASTPIAATNSAAPLLSAPLSSSAPVAPDHSELSAPAQPSTLQRQSDAVEAPLQISFTALHQPLAGGPLVPFGEGAKLFSGEAYQLRFTAQEQSWLYLLQIDSSQAIHCLFPRSCTASALRELFSTTHTNPVMANRPYHLPAEGRAFRLDDRVGWESFHLLAYRERNTQLEQTLARLQEARATDDRERLISQYRALALFIQSGGDDNVPPLTFQHAAE